MPTKHNKKRYQRHDKPQPTLNLSGRVWLEYQDEDALEKPGKGDLKLFSSVENMHILYPGDYERKGFSGYFRVDVWDGKDWRAVILSDLFEQREHYFSKTERPIDTFVLCARLLEARKGQVLRRTYREHYTLQETDGAE